MTLHVTEIFWGIDRKTGEFSERVTAEADLPCQEGPLPDLGHDHGRRCFVIREVGEKHIVLAVEYPVNPTASKSWTIRAGQEQCYRPRSFDGGYRYEFKLQK